MGYEVTTFQNIRLTGGWTRQQQGMTDTMIAYVAGPGATMIIDYEKPVKVPANLIVLLGVNENIAHIDFGPLVIHLPPITFAERLAGTKRRRKKQSGP